MHTITLNTFVSKADMQALIEEGRNQVLYLLLCLGDENVAHGNWHPEKADVLLEARREIVKRLKHPRVDGVMNTVWPKEWPDFENYTYSRDELSWRVR